MTSFFQGNQYNNEHDSPLLYVGIIIITFLSLYIIAVAIVVAIVVSYLSFK